jgi:hypothetical protein
MAIPLVQSIHSVTGGFTSPRILQPVLACFVSIARALIGVGWKPAIRPDGSTASLPASRYNDGAIDPGAQTCRPGQAWPVSASSDHAGSPAALFLQALCSPPSDPICRRSVWVFLLRLLQMSVHRSRFRLDHDGIKIDWRQTDCQRRPAVQLEVLDADLDGPRLCDRQFRRVYPGRVPVQLSMASSPSTHMRTPSSELVPNRQRPAGIGPRILL